MADQAQESPKAEWGGNEIPDYFFFTHHTTFFYMRHMNIKTWWQASRPFSFTVSVIPPILGTVIAKTYTDIDINWFFFALTLLGCVISHAGSNILSDYFDFKKGVDRAGTFGSSGVITGGKVSPRKALWGGLTCFAIAGFIGLYMILTVPNGLGLIWLILAGFFLGFFYTTPPFAIKYLALGDFAVALAFGVGMTLGAYFVQTGSYAWEPLLYSIPSALLVDAILHSNNLRDIANDSVVGIKTVAMLLGETNAKKMYYLLVWGAFATTAALILFADLSPFAALTILALPLEMKLVRTVKNKSLIDPKTFATIDAQTAQLHLVFSLLFIAGITIGSIFR